MKKDRLLKNRFVVHLLGLLMAFFFLSGFTAPEKPDYGIYDPNHYLTEEVVTQIRDLNATNRQKAEKLQIGVYIVDSLEGESIETVANETARAWRIGYSGDNFGSLIVVAVQDRKSRIETSNNTAIRITDYQTKQILAASRTDFKTGDYSKGILAIAKGLDNQFYRGTGTFASDDDSSDIKRYSESISGKKSNRDRTSSSNRRQKNDPIKDFFMFLTVIYFVGVIIAIIRGRGGGGGDSSDGGWWFSDSSDSGSSWSDSGSDSSSSWDGGGFDGGGSSDDW